MCRSTTDELMTHDNPCHPRWARAKKKTYFEKQNQRQRWRWMGRDSVSAQRAFHIGFSHGGMCAQTAPLFGKYYLQMQNNRENHTCGLLPAVFPYIIRTIFGANRRNVPFRWFSSFFSIFGANLMHKCEIFHKLLNNRDREKERDIWNVQSDMLMRVECVCVCAVVIP